MKKSIKYFTLILLVLLMNLVLLSANVYGQQSKRKGGDKNFLEKIKGIYNFDQQVQSRQIPFVYYINEAGFMLGDFYYNTDLFNNKTKITSVILYTPVDTTYAIFTDMKDYPLTEKLKLGSSLEVINYNDIRASTIGNGSENERIPKEYFGILEGFKAMSKTEQENIMQAFFTGNSSNLSSNEQEMLDKMKNMDKDKLDGYRLSKGRNISLGFNLTYEINENNSIITEYAYEELKTEKANDYKSDTISLAWENKNIDRETNPRKGHKIITKVKKSLDLLGHDSENNWDYTKLTFDIRKYIPVFKKSTLAFRFRTQTTSGTKVLDEERTFLKKIQTGDPNAKVYTYAPFFDMAILGSLDTMKGYYYYRFYDNNSVLYQTEFRFPLDNISPRLQGNVFLEAGRVGSDFNADLFTEDMHYSGGIGVRYFFNEDVVVRGDLGYSKESLQIRVNVGQTF